MGERLPSLTSKDVVRILEQRGFRLDRSKGSHHIFIHSVTNRRVVVPMHARDLPRGTLHEILRQAGLTRDDLD